MGGLVNKSPQRIGAAAPDGIGELTKLDGPS
jgi:hypothetical protein